MRRACSGVGLFRQPGQADLRGGIDLDCALRKAFEKQSAVAFRANSRIKNRDLATIGRAADESPKALLQTNCGFGHLVFHERVAAALFDSLDSRLEERM